MQFVEFETVDIVGHTLLQIEDIRGLASTADPDVCKITTPHDQILVRGTFESMRETFRSLVGGEWDATPADAGAPSE